MSSVGQHCSKDQGCQRNRGTSRPVGGECTECRFDTRLRSSYPRSGRCGFKTTRPGYTLLNNLGQTGVFCHRVRLTCQGNYTPSAAVGISVTNYMPLTRFIFLTIDPQESQPMAFGMLHSPETSVSSRWKTSSQGFTESETYK